MGLTKNFYFYYSFQYKLKNYFMNDKLQSIGKTYYAEKTDESFNKFYKSFFDIAYKVSKMILKSDDLAMENVSDTFLKIRKKVTEGFEFKEKMSQESFVYTVAMNKAKMKYNREFKRIKYKKITIDNFDTDIEETENIPMLMSFNNCESHPLGMIDNIIFHNGLVEPSEFESKIDDRVMVHHDDLMLNKEITNYVKNMKIDQDIIYDALINELPYNEIMKKYKNLKSVGCIKSKVFRARKNIKKHADSVVRMSKMMDGYIISGDVVLTNDDGIITKKAHVIKNVLDGVVEFFYDNGNHKATIKYKNGEKNGEYVRYYENDSVMIRGCYKNDKMCGEWTYYRNNKTRNKRIEYSNYEDMSLITEYKENGTDVISSIIV